MGFRGASGVFVIDGKIERTHERMARRAFSVIQVPSPCSAVRVRSFTIHFDFPAKDNASARTAGGHVVGNPSHMKCAVCDR